MGILDVTKEQLRQLDGDSLRELVALLCEAEIQKAGLSVSAGGEGCGCEGSNPPMFARRLHSFRTKRSGSQNPLDQT